MMSVLVIVLSVLLAASLAFGLYQRDGKLKARKEAQQMAIHMRERLRARTMTIQNDDDEEEEDKKDYPDAEEYDTGPKIYRVITPVNKPIPSPFAPKPETAEKPQTMAKPEPETEPEHSKPMTAKPQEAKPEAVFKDSLFEPELELFTGPAPKKDPEFMEKVNSCILQHLHEADFGVEELSASLGISRVHLNRKFKDNVEMTPVAMIKKARLEESVKLLIVKDANIYEIAQKCGFGSASYFSTVFKTAFGMTPKDFSAKYMGHTYEEAITKLL